MVAKAWDRRLTVAGGVPAGAKMPNQVVISKPGKVSAMVGTLGAPSSRLGSATAKTLMRPESMWALRAAKVEKITGTLPPSTSLMAGEMPL